MRMVTGVLALAVSITVAAQQAPPVFRSNVSLMIVEATVLDRDGRPVPGLTADDFRITLNGKLQPVRTLSYVQVDNPEGPGQAPAGPDVTAIPGGRRIVTNAGLADNVKTFVVVVDDLSFPPDGGRRTMAAARKFVARQPANVFIGVATTTGAVAVNPTRDRSLVETMLTRIVGQFIDPRRASSPVNPSVSISEAIEIAHYNNTSVLGAAITRECIDGGQPANTGGDDTGRHAISVYNTKCATDLMSAARTIASQTTGTTGRQVSSITQVLDAMKGAPGLKQVIVLTQGIATSRELLTVFRPITRSAALAGVQISVLMEDEDDNEASNQGRITSEMLGMRLTDVGIASRRREDRRMFTNALQALADTAGGTFELVVANSDGAFARAATAGSAVYRLGVEAPSGVDASDDVEVSASVDRDGVRVHANRSAVLPSAAAPATASERVAAAIRRGTPHFAVPLRVAITRRRAADNQVELGVGLTIPGTVAGPLTVTLGLVNETGALKQGTRAVSVPPGGAEYATTMPMAVVPGLYRVRVAVQDADGGVGSVESEIDARLTPMGSLLASDLLTWWRDAKGRPQFLALDQIPPGVESLSAGLELYTAIGTAFPTDLRVLLSIVSATGETVAQVNLTPRVEGDTLRAEASLPVRSLPPGVYVIRAAVAAGGAPLGDVSSHIRVPAAR